MKKILIFGFGEMGIKLVDECLKYGDDISISAIVDNRTLISEYKGIQIISPDKIKDYSFDEIWICTVYFKEIVKQLIENYGLQEKQMHFVEPVVPILEMRLRKKYQEEINNPDIVSGDKREIFKYLQSNKLRMYSYPFYNEYLNKESPIGFDESNGLFFGLYEGKKMYLARKFNTEQKARAYFNAVTMEQDNRSPHCYWNNDNLCVETGVGVDIGAAEGIFALKIIEQIKHVYLIEVDECWIEALRYTFAPYMDKVTIIRKFIGDIDSEENARLDTLLFNKKIDFIKMDIEGMELRALQGAERIILDNNVRLAVCVYHYQNDNQRIGQWLGEHGYKCTNSQGYVLCQGDWELENNDIDFRRALLFAEKDMDKAYENFSSMYTEL